MTATSPLEPAAPTAPTTPAGDQNPQTDDIREGVVRSLSQVLGRELRDVGPETRLFEDLNLDSTSLLELLMAIEEDLGVEFDAEDLEQQHFQTILSLSSFVRTVAAAG